ncbi:MAG: phosphoribosylglycinamide formyltransferase [Ignavibacteriae bacterium HGW-Ignavibacteriae-1]|jgi:phosphoribosylglycinamide formyltransferase-1|nr:MAG: phosphoribosylglycinamide formyltransferase [Ignavibacteriae bacterium HGW-Ignavibacteriae-1]
MSLRIAFFASHGGSNMQAIIDAIKSGETDAVAALVISNNSESGAIERAKKEGIPFSHISSKTHPDENERISTMIEKLDECNIDLIILAGYMKKIPSQIIEHVGGRVLNIHPALLPKFGGEGMYGMNVHKAVIESGETVSGATVHLVDSEYDRGRILMQKEVPVLADDTPETLAARVLVAEHLLYKETLKKIISGDIII